jgi:hypothetical protein
MADNAQTARCPLCRGRVAVEERDADGDQIHCDNCHSALRVRRRQGSIRLVVADVGPLRDELRTLQQRQKNLESDLQRARASFGIGANGIGFGVAYVVWQVALENALLSTALLVKAVAIAVVTGVLLEVANYFFFAKRSAITRLTAEIAELREQIRGIQQTIRDATRG